MSAALREKIIRLLLRITDEQVPLLCSDRLRTVHKDCRVLLDELTKEQANAEEH
jgi:hypothetical protein